MAGTNLALADDMETSPQEGMSDDELATLLHEQEKGAISYRDTVLADEQSAAIDYYEAQPFGDEEEGRSQVVVPDVREVVTYMQISLLRTCISGDRVVEFEPGDTDQIPELPDPPEKPNLPPQAAVQPGQPPAPVDPAIQAQMASYAQQKAEYDQAVAPFKKWEKERTQRAEDATEAVNYTFLRRQDGYKVLVDWVQSGLIEKYGVVKTACVTERKKIKQMIQIPEEGLVQLQQEGANVVAAQDNGDGSWLVVIAQEKEVKRYLDYPIPSEEFLFGARTRHEDDHNYKAHKSLKTYFELIEMGFDRDLVDTLPVEDNNLTLDQRNLSRWRDEIEANVRPAPGMQTYWLLEEYLNIDQDGDGIAELWKVFRVKDVILEKTEVDENPFVLWTPFPRAHRMVGDSLAESVMDIQRIDSVLLRQGLDGVYQTNNPRTAVSIESLTDDTLDDLMTVRPGGIVRYRGANAPAPLNEGFDIQKSLGMLEYMTGMRETRTGITRLNQGLDEDTLNKTASGQAALQATGQQIEEFVARNFAEAMARLFAKKLRLMAEHGEPMAIKVDGNYRRMDPSTWDTEMNVAVRVGLGSGKKDQRLIYRQQLAMQQQEGLAIGIVDPKRIYNNVTAMVRDAGLGSPDDYWLDPDSDEYQEAQANKPAAPQDPAVIKAQADAIYQQQKGQAEAGQSQAKIALSQQESQAKLAISHEQGQQQIQLAAAKAAQEQELARQKADFEATQAQISAERDWQIAQAQLETDRQIAAQKLANEHDLATKQQEHDHMVATTRLQHDHEINTIKAKQQPKLRPGGDLSK